MATVRWITVVALIAAGWAASYQLALLGEPRSLWFWQTIAVLP